MAGVTSAPEGPHVRTEHVDTGDRGVVALLTVSDPRRRNAMTAALSDGLVAAVEAAAADPGVHAVVLTGAAPAFCAGGDLDELAAAGGAGDETPAGGAGDETPAGGAGDETPAGGAGDETPAGGAGDETPAGGAGDETPAGGAGDETPAGDAGEDALHRIYAGFLAVARCPLPVIAAVDGPAVGAGLNLALAADVRLAGATARFDPGFLRLGVHPGGGMTWMAQRAVGPQATLAMLLGGEGLDAARAVEVGLALRAVPEDGGEGDRTATVVEALRMARTSARAPRELVVATKASIRATGALAGADAHERAVAVEIGPQLESLRSEGFREGLETVRSRR